MYTTEAKSAILACLFARLDSEEGNREMGVPDVQGPEQGTIYFMIKN